MLDVTIDKDGGRRVYSREHKNASLKETRRNQFLGFTSVRRLRK